jgi:hypothetical protein
MIWIIGCCKLPSSGLVAAASCYDPDYWLLQVDIIWISGCCKLPSSGLVAAASCHHLD